MAQGMAAHNGMEKEKEDMEKALELYKEKVQRAGAELASTLERIAEEKAARVLMEGYVLPMEMGDLLTAEGQDWGTAAAQQTAGSMS